MNLEEKMLENWDEVRERFFYPDLPLPRLCDSDKIKTACIDMIGHQILINRDFIDDFQKKGVDLETILKGLLSHEVNHYVTCPFDLTRSLWIDVLARKVNKDVAKTSTSIYVDIIDNLDLLMRKNYTEVGELLKYQEADNPLSKIIKAYYQKVSGYDLDFDSNVELDDAMKSQLNRICTIDFFNTKNEARNVTRFTRIIGDIIKKYNLDANKIPNLGNFDAESYDINEIKRALKELAKKVSKDEFDDCIETNQIIKIMGIGSGNNDGQNIIKDVLYYQNLAENFPLEVKKRKIQENGDLYPHSHKSYEIEDSPQDIDAFSSFGKPFIPGLGKTWVKKQGKHYSKKETTPNVLIMKDISGSMCCCEPHAEVACIATANAYLANSSEVATYLFNDNVDEDELAKGYQSNSSNLALALIKSNGGGTAINSNSLSKLDDIIKKSEKELDVVLVTDLEISGRDELFKYLHDRQDTHRVTIIYTGTNGGITELQEKYNDSKFAIYQVTKPEDIPDVVVGEINRGII